MPEKESQKSNSIFSVFLAYFYQYRMIIFFYLVVVAIFSGVLYLYRVNMEAVGYAIFLSLLLCLVIVPIHFLTYYRRYKAFRSLLENQWLVASQIPEGRNLEENNYRELLIKWLENTAKEKSRLQYFKEESVDYYSTWVHQIKTPIAVMRLCLQEEDTKENEKLLLELFKIEQYVDMVLSHFRLEGEERDLVIKEYSLDDIIRSCIRKYASWFVAKGLQVKYEGTDQKVLTDKKWLTFMIEQLLSNAVKYTDKGHITIEVDKDSTVTIKDTGIGIAKEDLPRIFEKGYTGYNGRADKKSTGIGLYLVKRTADMLGVSVKVDSVPGEGTASVLYFSPLSH